MPLHTQKGPYLTHELCTQNQTSLGRRLSHDIPLWHGHNPGPLCRLDYQTLGHLKHGMSIDTWNMELSKHWEKKSSIQK